MQLDSRLNHKVIVNSVTHSKPYVAPAVLFFDIVAVEYPTVAAHVRIGVFYRVVEIYAYIDNTAEPPH